jgi:hypothetical protein
MIKKGFDLFTTSPSVLEGKVTADNDPRCCEVCTSPFFNLCKLFCKCRKGTLFEFIRDFLSKRGERK